MAKATVRGGRQLANNLRSMSQAFSAREMDAVCEASLAPIEEETVKNALALRDFTHNPPGGHLDEGVVIVKVKAEPGFRTFWVSFTKRARKIAHLVEFGTSPHWQPHYRGGWMHPGARRKPFFRPAFEAEKNRSLSVFATMAFDIINRKAAGLPKDGP